MKNFFTLFVLFTMNISVFAQTNSFSLESKKLAKGKIDSIRKEIANGKLEFATAAKKYSQDPGSASNGGLYVKILRGTFVSEFEKVAFNIEVGKLSEVFETNFGYHILKVDRRYGDTIDVRHIIIIPDKR